MKQVHRLVPEMKGVQYDQLWKQEDLLEASELSLEAQEHHLNQEYQDAQESPGEPQERGEINNQAKVTEYQLTAKL